MSGGVSDGMSGGMTATQVSNDLRHTTMSELPETVSLRRACM